MKKRSTLIMMVVTLAVALLTIGACQKGLFNTRQDLNSHLGTWKAVSYKYGTTSSSFIDFPPSQLHIKVITPSQYIWVSVDTLTKRVYEVGGGRYTLDGNTYVEQTDFSLGNDGLRGQKHTFTIKVEGDMFFQSGQLSSGLKIEEIWQRME